MLYKNCFCIFCPCGKLKDTMQNNVTVWSFNTDAIVCLCCYKQTFVWSCIVELYCSRNCYSSLCVLCRHMHVLGHSTYLCLPTDVMQESMEIHSSSGRISSLERVLTLIIPHIGQNPCICPNIDPQRSFFSQILTIPFLWRLFPYIKEVRFLWSPLILFFCSYYFYL